MIFVQRYTYLCFSYNKCGHRNVLSKRQVWMSIFHIILQSVHLLYTYAIRIIFCFIRTRRINFSAYEYIVYLLTLKKKNSWTQGPGFFLIKINPGLLFLLKITGAWGMDFVSSSPFFSTTPLFSKFSYKSFLFQNFHNHSFFLHLTISVDVIHHE